MTSERELIQRVSRAFRSRPPSDLRVGIGDDAAILRVSPRTQWVLTTDAFIENIHFAFPFHPPRDAGYKALARAASDLAAKGAEPRFFLMNLALSPRSTGKWLDHFLGGMSTAARRFGMTLIGGDTTQDDRVAVNLCLLGVIRNGRAVLRSGACPRDLIFVSGPLGRAALGLRLASLPSAARRRWSFLLQRHLRPEPRLHLGQTLAKHGLASAMIDVSDGLSTDLGHLCEASGVGATIDAAKIPKVAVPAELKRFKLDPLTLALHGGDDYELLFTVPPRRAHRLSRLLSRLLPPDGSFACIGEITQEKKVVLLDAAGRSTPLRPLGWDPFTRNSTSGR